MNENKEPSSGSVTVLETLPISCVSSVHLWPSDECRMDIKLYDEVSVHKSQIRKISKTRKIRKTRKNDHKDQKERLKRKNRRKDPKDQKDKLKRQEENN